MLRNNSNKETYQQQAKLIKKKFQNRDYPQSITNQDIPDFNSRLEYLTAKEKDPANSITFVTNFDPSIPTNHILNQHWPILFSEESLRSKLRNKPRISYRASPNLGKTLTRAQTDAIFPLPENSIKPIVRRPPSLPAKTISCRVTNCASCLILTNKSHFISYQMKNCYELESIYSCDTTNAIYLLECSICQKQYVGETGTTIRIRMRHHRKHVSGKNQSTNLQPSRKTSV